MAETLTNSLSLRKNFSWIFVGYIVYVACQWGILVVLAKLGSPRMVGEFALGLAVTAPIVLFANLGLRAFQATDAERRYDFSDYLGLRILTTVLAFATVLVVVLVSGYGGEVALVIVLVGLAKCFEAISDIYYGLLQQRERMDRISKSMMMRGLLSLAALGAAMYFTGSVLWGVAAMAGTWALILFSYDLRSGVRVIGSRSQSDSGGSRPGWDAARLKSLVLTTLPLGLSVVMISLNTNIPRYLIENYLTTRDLGIFAALAYPAAAGATVVGALGQSASPRLARHYAEGDAPAFRALLVKLLGLGAAFGVAGIIVAALAGKDILKLFYTPEYAEYSGVFLLLMGAAGISYVASFVGFAMIAARRIRTQIPLFGCVILVTTVTCLVFAPSLGLLGIAVGVTAGVLFQLVAGVSVILYALAAMTREEVLG